jgi:hypothetical protein
MIMKDKRHSLFIYCLALLILLTTLSCKKEPAKNEPSVDPLIALARQNKIKGDRNTAEIAYKKALNLHQKLKNYDGAEKEYIAALKSDPSHGLSYYQLACIAALTNRPDTATELIMAGKDLDGFPLDWVGTDSDLSSIRNRAEIKSLIGKNISLKNGYDAFLNRVLGCESMQSGMDNFIDILMKPGGGLSGNINNHGIGIVECEADSWKVEENTLKMFFHCVRDFPPDHRKVKEKKVVEFNSPEKLRDFFFGERCGD